MSVPLITTVGLVVLGMVAATAPELLLRITPPRLRDDVYLSRGSPALAGAGAALPIVLTYWLGAAGAGSGTSSVGLGVVLVVFFGLPVAGAFVHSWLVSRGLHQARSAVPGPTLPVDGTATTAWLARSDINPADLQSGDRRAHALDRGLRRLGAGAAVVAVVLYTAGRLAQGLLRLTEPPLLAGAVFVTAALLVLAIPFGLRVRVRRAIRRRVCTPLASGTLETHNDTERLGSRFSGAPLLRTSRPQDLLRQTYVAEGKSGDRHWWACLQRGQLFTGPGIAAKRMSQRQSTVLIWLPGVDLPRIEVCERDTTGVGTWFTASTELESWDFNEVVHVPLADGDVTLASDVSAVLHPQMMQHLLAHLPDGSVLLVQGCLLSLVLDREVLRDEVGGLVAFALVCADLLPSYWLKQHAVEEGAH